MKKWIYAIIVLMFFGYGCSSNNTIDSSDDAAQVVGAVSAVSGWGETSSSMLQKQFSDYQYTVNSSYGGTIKVDADWDYDTEAGTISGSDTLTFNDVKAYVKGKEITINGAITRDPVNITYSYDAANNSFSINLSATTSISQALNISGQYEGTIDSGEWTYNGSITWSSSNISYNGEVAGYVVVNGIRFDFSESVSSSQ